MEESCISLTSDSEDVVNMFIENDLASGYNPFECQVFNGGSKYREEWEDMDIGEVVDLLIKEQG